MIMGWKSTIKELAEMLVDYGFGDDIKLKWYGYNFIVTDEEE